MNTSYSLCILDAETLGDVDFNVEFGEFGKLTVYDRTSPDETISRLQEVDIVITNKVLISKEVIDACQRLKLICVSATGTNNVDLDYAAGKNIPVMNVAGYSTNSVAQFTFASLFYLTHQLHYYDTFVKEGSYEKSTIFTHIHHNFNELEGKVFGIIGLGNIGRKVAQIAEAFGARVIYYSTSGKNSTTDYKKVDLETLFKQSDVISIHCPLNEQTQNLIGSQQLNAAKKNLILINMGRGGIVNEQDLAEAIDDELIAGAITDVLTQEPVHPKNPLLHVKKKDALLITPHIAWASVEARKLLIQKIRENLFSFIQK
jgi:lactate dehydrogenase-like 2-hydroxyacid dehydrogenase